MKYFLMNGHIDKEMLQRFVDFYNATVDEDTTIILETVGGGFRVSETIIHLINSKPNTTIIVLSALSAGMMILEGTTCKKILSKSCMGMWHYGKWEIDYNDKNKPYYHQDEATISNLPFHARDTMRVAKKIMTPKELKRFKNDYDIYFNAKRMREIFPDAKQL